MAVAAALSPWPATTAAVAHAAAIARLRLYLGLRDSERCPDESVSAVGATASARVERYAPGAPQSARDEATIRFAGYLVQSNFGTIRQETLGPHTKEYVTAHANAWRNCGAAMVLSPWRVRRAGAIG